MARQAQELFRRLRLMLAILRWGDLVNGNLKHLRAMMAELQYIATHQRDMTKDEIVTLVIGATDKPETGMLHHLAHVLTSQNWRIVRAEMQEAEWLDAKRRVKEALAALRGE